MGIPRKPMAQWAVRYESTSIRFACRTLSISEACYRYQPNLSAENDLIADFLVTLTKPIKACVFGLRTWVIPHWGNLNQFQMVELYIGPFKLSQQMNLTVPDPSTSRTLDEQHHLTPSHPLRATTL